MAVLSNAWRNTGLRGSQKAVECELSSVGVRLLPGARFTLHFTRQDGLGVAQQFSVELTPAEFLEARDGVARYVKEYAEQYPGLLG